MSLKTIVLTLTVTMDETNDIESDARELEDAIRSRLFGQGVFPYDTTVDEWDTTFILKP